MVTQERLKEVLHYDLETGAWTWVVRKAKCIQIGDIAGKIDSHGYRQITIDGASYLASRLAFLWVDGAWPDLHVDHKDVDHSNNSWSNLRLATRSQNGGNRKAYKNNKLGVKGARKTRSGRYEVQLQVDGVNRYIGTYSDLEAATAAYTKAALEAFGSYHRAR